ncbi:MAG: cell wall-binding repeat-containing protein [Actinomycetota bacterium]|nr:cell wall-binding repeat-containing protein [Actinomycetota bacterium]
MMSPWIRARIVVLVVLAMLVAGVQTAYAAAPPTTPATVRSIDFESAIPSDMSIWGVVYTFPPKDPTAWWGRITNRKYAGSYGLWCAGNMPANWTTYGGKYPERTRGIADLYLPQLADYYSSEFSYYYSMPNYGLYDSSSFNPMWYSEADPTDRDTNPFRPTTKYAEWSQDKWNLSNVGNDVNLSRESGYFRFQFVDNGEGYLQTPTTGEGATVDNIVVTGYKYGPVRTLTGTPSTGQVVLNWLRPYRAAGATTLEERSITYRVWRAYDVVNPSWTELTTVRLTSPTFTDSTVAEGTRYRYIVQAWDDGTGIGYGSTTQVIVTASGGGGGTLPPTEVDRLASDTRFSTAIAIAREGFDSDPVAAGTQWTSVKDVIIASGEDRAAADPLAASGLCGAYDAPLFLVKEGSTPSEVKIALKEIVTQNGTVTVHIVGGPASVSDSRYNELVSYVGSGKLIKDRLLSTGTRYDMARAIAERMRSLNGGVPPSAVLVANGADPAKFFDALALSPIAASKGYPILLVSATGVPSSTEWCVKTYKPSKVIIGGGPATVGSSVKSRLKTLAGVTPEQWYGKTKYTTAQVIADNAVSRGYLTRSAVGIAAKLPDALTGGSVIGRFSGVLLITPGDALAGNVSTWLTAHKAEIHNCYVFGGTASVKPTVLTAITNKLK